VQSENTALRHKVAQLDGALRYKSKQLKYSIQHVQFQEKKIQNQGNTICNLTEIKHSLVQNKVLIESDLQVIKDSYSKLNDTVQRANEHHCKITMELEERWKKENEKCVAIRLELEKERLLRRSHQEMDLARQIFLKQTLQEKDELEVKLEKEIEILKSGKKKV